MYTYIYIYRYIRMYVYMCVCVCVCVFAIYVLAYAHTQSLMLSHVCIKRILDPTTTTPSSPSPALGFVHSFTLVHGSSGP